MKLSLKILFLVLLVSGFSHSADLQSHLASAQKYYDSEVLPSCSAMNESSRVAYEKSKKSKNKYISQALESIRNCTGDLRYLKEKIEHAFDFGKFDAQSLQARQTLAALILTHYKALEQVLALPALSQSLGVDLISGRAIDELKLKLSVRDSFSVKSFFIRQLLEKNQDADTAVLAKNIIIQQESSKSDVATLELAPGFLKSLGLTTLNSFPSEALIKDQMRRMALSFSFLHLANIRSYLDVEDRNSVDYKPNQGLSDADRTYLKLQYEEAVKHQMEQDFRPTFLAQAFPLIAEKVLGYFNESQAQKIAQGMNGILKKFKTHVNPEKAKIPSIAVTNSLLRTYDNMLLKMLIEKGVSVPFHLHDLSEDNLRAALTTLVRDSLYEGFVFVLGCNYFKDKSGEQSQCHTGGTAAPVIFDTENSWTKEEIQNLRQAIYSLLPEELPGFDASIIQIVQRISNKDQNLSASERRYQLAAFLIEASELRDQIDEKLKALAASGEKGETPQSAIDDLGIIPGATVLSFYKSAFLQEEIPLTSFAPWMEYPFVILASYRDRFWKSADSQKLNMPKAFRSQENFLAAVKNLQNSVFTLTQVLKVQEQILSTVKKHSKEEKGAFSFIGEFFSDAKSSMQEKIIESFQKVELKALSIVIAAYEDVNKRRASKDISFSEKISLIRAKLEASKDGNKTEGLKIVDGFLNILKAGSELELEKFSPSVQGAFESVMKRDLNQLIELNQQVTDFSGLVAHHRAKSLIDSLFAGPGYFDRHARAILANKVVFAQYMRVLLDLMEPKLPGIYKSIEAPGWVSARHDQETQDIRLYGLVKAVSKKLANPSFIQEVLKRLNALKKELDSESFNYNELAQNAFNFDLKLLGEAAAEETMNTQRMASDDFADGWLSFVGSVTSLNVKPKIGYSRDEWWPTGVRYIDLWPALGDRLLYDSCFQGHDDEKAARHCVQQKKVQRILISTLLRPFFLSSVVESEGEIFKLSDRNYDVMRALTQSEGLLSELYKEAPKVEEGINRVIEKENHIKNIANKIKEKLSPINRQLFHLYLGSTLFPQAKIPPKVHFYGGLLMFIPATFELGTTMTLNYQYYKDFMAFQDFSGSNILPGNLIEDNEANKMYAQFYDATLQNVHSLPMHLSWSYGMIHSISYGRGTKIAAPGASGGGYGGPQNKNSSSYVKSTPTAADYNVLGLAYGESNPAVIRAAAQKMAKRYHPDRNPNDSLAAQRFNEVNIAREKIERRLKAQGLWKK